MYSKLLPDVSVGIPRAGDERRIGKDAQKRMRRSMAPYLTFLVTSYSAAVLIRRDSGRKNWLVIHRLDSQFGHRDDPRRVGSPGRAGEERGNTVAASLSFAMMQ